MKQAHSLSRQASLPREAAAQRGRDSLFIEQRLIPPNDQNQLLTIMKIFTFGTLLLSLAVVAQACWLGDWWRSYMSDEEQVKGSTPAEIAQALTRLYKFFIKIGYVTEEEMRWPPHSTSDLDVDMLRSQGLGDDALALLKKIPWSTSRCYLDFESASVNFSDDVDVAGSRVPDYYQEAEGDVVVDPWMLVIAIRDGYGGPICLDTRQGMLLRRGPNGYQDAHGYHRTADNGRIVLSGFNQRTWTRSARFPEPGRISRRPPARLHQPRRHSRQWNYPEQRSLPFTKLGKLPPRCLSVQCC